MGRHSLRHSAGTPEGGQFRPLLGTGAGRPRFAARQFLPDGGIRNLSPDAVARQRDDRPAHRRTAADHYTSLYVPPQALGGGRRTLRRFTPGLWTHDDGTHEEVRIESRFHRGTQGPWQPHPRGGTHRPLLRAAGFIRTAVRRVRST
ncbi:MAG TPA: hypothetical protein VFM37_08155 [Pseudonocardiaceae bacterium]|nr:hypothetical protein [Pseudonocardiaceae bacterium]